MTGNTFTKIGTQARENTIYLSHRQPWMVVVIPFHL